jgi:hypothetical protein
MSGRRRVQFSGEAGSSSDFDDDLLDDILKDSPVGRRKKGGATKGPPAAETPTDVAEPTAPSGAISEKPSAFAVAPPTGNVDSRKKLMQELFLGVKEPKPVVADRSEALEDKTTTVPQSPSSSLLSQPAAGANRADKPSPSVSLRPPSATSSVASSGESKPRPGVSRTGSMDFDDDDGDILGKLEQRPRRPAAAAGSKLMDDIFGRKDAAAVSSSTGFMDSLLTGNSSAANHTKSAESSKEFQLDARYKQAGGEKPAPIVAETSSGLFENNPPQRRRRGGQQPTVGVDLGQQAKQQAPVAEDDNPFPWMAKE